jgi:hypothetical protein
MEPNVSGLSRIRARRNRPEMCPFDFDGSIAFPTPHKATLILPEMQGSPEIDCMEKDVRSKYSNDMQSIHE